MPEASRQGESSRFIFLQTVNFYSEIPQRKRKASAKLMEIRGEEKIAAPRAAVWRTLNDTSLLIGCIPGCEKLERVCATHIEATIVVKLGLVKLRFHGQLILSNLNPPVSYTISGEGRGAMSGLASGHTDVRLEEDNGDTRLSYVMHGNAEGKLAQLGSKLLSRAARRIADRFFTNVAEIARGLG